MSSSEQSAYRDHSRGKSMHGRIVRELGLRIVSGQIAPGDRLPVEPALLQQYEISRPVLREAIRVLVAKGLVLSRQRAGNTVRPRTEWHLLDPDVLVWLIQTCPRPEFVKTLMEVRRVFEPAAAAMAAQAATVKQLEGISAAYASMESARTPGELVEPDLAFHGRIAEAAGNDLIAYIGTMLSLALRETIQLSSRHPQTHELSLPRHKAILTALLARDPLGARQAAMVQLQMTDDVLASMMSTPLPSAAGSSTT